MTEYTKEQIAEFKGFLDTHPELNPYKAPAAAVNSTVITPQQAAATTIDELNRQIAELKSINEKTEDKTSQMIKSALADQVRVMEMQREQEKEREVIISELKSFVSRDRLEDILKDKPSTESLKSIQSMMIKSGLDKFMVGANTGNTLTSTEEKSIKAGLQALSIPRIEFIGDR